MSVAVAKSSMGFCLCGMEISPGERYRTLAGTAVHVGCEGKAHSTETAPTLFALTAAAPEPPKKPQRVFAPVSLGDGQRASAPRLVGQLGRTYETMQSVEWITLEELAKAVGALETAVSARLRNLRAMGHRITLRRRDDGRYEYRMIKRASGADAAA